jgi:thioredoxin reductase (NADPH)
MFDLAIVGAGPIGIESAILAKRAGLTYVVLEQGAIVNAIYHYPTYMTFFTTSDRLEVGGHPLVTSTEKPTRKEALDYYRKVVHNEALHVRTFTKVTGMERGPDGFALGTTDEHGATGRVEARLVALATGYFDNPKLLGVPGEDLPNVSHYYTEAHPFYGRNVTIVGAGSSAADTALDLYRGGARVTILHRGDDFRHSLKYWVRPDLVNRVKEGSITAHFNTVVREITPSEVVAEKQGEQLRIPTDHTFALTGYFASPNLLTRLGVDVDRETKAANLDPDTFESNVPGLYLIGSAGFGTRTSDVFIENGLVHAAKALGHMVERLSRDAVFA